MKKFIHLRGSMASGKTSTARSVIERGNYEVRFLNIAGKEYPYTYDPKKNWVVTGRYDTRVCGGLDGVIKNRDLMKLYLYKLLSEVKPNVIVFEAVMYGITYKFGKECSDLCKREGYQYVGVLLAPDFDIVLANIYKRNGGKQINVERLSAKYFSGLNAAKKLAEAGIKIVYEDTSKYDLNELYKIVEKLI